MSSPGIHRSKQLWAGLLRMKEDTRSPTPGPRPQDSVALASLLRALGRAPSSPGLRRTPVSSTSACSGHPACLRGPGPRGGRGDSRQRRQRRLSGTGSFSGTRRVNSVTTAPLSQVFTPTPSRVSSPSTRLGLPPLLPPALLSRQQLPLKGGPSLGTSSSPAQPGVTPAPQTPSSAAAPPRHFPLTRTHRAEEEPGEEAHRHCSRAQRDEDDFPRLQGPGGPHAAR